MQVYEMLSNLNLPDWGRGNWTCKIRQHTSILPEYANIGHCQDGPADFVYNDHTGALTGIMVQHGYLNQDVWGEMKPKYLFIVKSTTGSNDVPFHIGRSEFELVCFISLSSPKVINVRLLTIHR